MCIFAEVIRNACFLGHALEIFMNPMRRPIRANSGPSERLADSPKHLFARESQVFQHPIVQQAQVLPSLSAGQPHFYCPDPSPKVG